jgi:hypothetical protein
LVYSADYRAMNDLVSYLMENCCAASACAPDPGCGDAALPTQTRKIA